MKKILFALVSILLLNGVYAQDKVKISELPVYTGTPIGVTVPVVVGGINRKMDGYYFASMKIDSVWFVGNTLYVKKNGVTVSSLHTHPQSEVTNLADSLLARYTKAQIEALLAAKLSISDTSSMLANYRRKTTLIENADLRYSTISGVSLGANLSQLQWGYGFSNTTSYDGSASILQKVDTSEISTKANVTALLLGKQPLLGYTAENVANKGASNGYAPLEADTKIATTYLPAITMNNVYTAGSQAAMLALSAVVGDMCVRTDSSITYVLQVASPSNPAAWVKILSPSAPVSSVNGKTGVVSLLTSDISEGGTTYYWTAARSRAAQSVSAVGLTYNNTTGDISITAGYVIPTTTDISNGNTAYSKRVTAVALSTSTLTITFADASTVTASVPTFNQNTSGNAATATLASNSTQWNGATNNFAVTQTTGLTSVNGFDGSNVMRAFSPAAVQSFIGLSTTNWVDISSTQTITGAKTFSSAITASNFSIGSWTQETTSNHLTLNYSGEKYRFRTDGTFQMLNGGGVEIYKNGSNSVGVGPYYQLVNAASTVSWLMQLNGSNDLDFWSYISGVWGVKQTFKNDGSVVFAAGISSGDITVNGDNKGVYFNGTRNAILGSNATDEVYIAAGNATRITVGATSTTVSTQLGVNTTNPSSWNFAVGANSGNGIRLYSGTSTSNATWDVYTDATYGSIMRMYANNGTTINITMRGDGLATFASSVTATAFYEGSDIRQKKVHKTFASADGINAIQYTFKPSGELKMGYSAQQVRNVLPYAVHEDSEGWLKVDYTSVHTYKIMMLEKRITELEKLLK